MWKAFRRALHRIAVFQISLLLFLLYLAVVVPLGFLEKLLVRPSSGSQWQDFQLKYHNLEDLQEQ